MAHTVHLVISGDCLDKLPETPDGIIDLVVADPPFNIGKYYGGVYKDFKKKSAYLDWCHSWLTECVRVMKDGAAIYLFNYPENNAYLMPWLDERLSFNGWLTWHYPTNLGASKRKFTRSQTSILFYIKGSSPLVFNRAEIAIPYRNPKDKRIKALIAAGSPGKTPYDVFHHNLVKNTSRQKTRHPCQVPEDLLKTFIKASSNERGIVLDPFAGSFSTALVAQQLNRNSISIEINPEYCKIGRERIGI